jgi:prevent-host-death family protein
MSRRYSTCEAKAKFSEIVCKVRAGQHVTISYRGEAVAEIRPVYGARKPEEIVREMEEQGVLSPHAAPSGGLEPIARKPGALKRFLESRE